MNRLDIIMPRVPIQADYAPGTLELVTQHDGNVLRLRKLVADYDPSDRLTALSHLQQRADAGEIVTGLLYVDPQGEDLHDHLNTVDTPLNRLGEAELVPGAKALEKLNASLR
jgi:2-oxoglutarate ferredoxin oxidoreductase subunit beta